MLAKTQNFTGLRRPFEKSLQSNEDVRPFPVEKWMVDNRPLLPTQSQVPIHQSDNAKHMANDQADAGQNSHCDKNLETNRTQSR